MDFYKKGGGESGKFEFGQKDSPEQDPHDAADIVRGLSRLERKTLVAVARPERLEFINRPPEGRTSRQYTDRWYRSYLRGPHRSDLTGAWERLQKDLPTVRRILQQEGLPIDIIHLAIAESHWKQKARSWAGAAGYWQFMPGTARRFGLRVGRGVDERYHLEKSTRAACEYLKILYKLTYKWEGRPVPVRPEYIDPRRWTWAFWSYNAGEGRVGKRFKRTHGQPELYFAVCGNLESRNYAPKIFGIGRALTELRGGRMPAPEPAPEQSLSKADLMYEEYNRKTPTTKEKRIAILANILDKYTGEGQAGTHTPDYVENALAEVEKVLRDVRAEGKEDREEVPEEKEEGVINYAVKPGDNLVKIATWLAPSASAVPKTQKAIRSFNTHIKNWNRVYASQTLRVPGDIITVPNAKLSGLLKKYYPGVQPDTAIKYLKWLNGKDPNTEKIKPGDTIVVPGKIT